MANSRRIKAWVIAFAVATVAAGIVSAVIIMVVNANLMKMPLPGGTGNVPKVLSVPAKGNPPKEETRKPETDYSAITERNLFRAKLQVEIPKPRTEKEIEEEALTGALREMTLKGVWMGREKEDTYAVIDKGGQKGVWTYQMGEVVDKGLQVSEIKQNAVTLSKGDFKANLRLFAKGFERSGTFQPASTPVPEKRSVEPQRTPQKTAAIQPDLLRQIRTEGNTVIIPKALSDRIKTDNSLIMSSVAVRASVDDQGKANGYRVVSVDKGSVAERVGIMAGDVVQEINGLRLASSADLNSAYNKFRNESKFVVKVLRNGRTQDLAYDVR
jgi:type II secretory pathway component PulC